MQMGSILGVSRIMLHLSIFFSDSVCNIKKYCNLKLLFSIDGSN